MLALAGLAVGVVIGLLVEPTLPVFLQPYLPIAIVAALDAILGGTRSWLEGVFSDRVFVVSFLSNVLIAGLIVFVGDQIGVGSQLSTGRSPAGLARFPQARTRAVARRRSSLPRGTARGLDSAFAGITT